MQQPRRPIRQAALKAVQLFVEIVRFCSHVPFQTGIGRFVPRKNRGGSAQD